MKYGYARVSTKGQANDGNSLEAQESLLKENGAERIFFDSCTGTKINRPEFDKLLVEMHSGDMLIVSKLDRVARSAVQGIELINNLLEKGIIVNILNMGIMDNTPTGKLMRTMMLAFAEFERDMIIERTQEGKAIARQKDGFKEGRPKKYSKKQLDHAMELLKSNSYKQVYELTGISTATLAREKAKRK